MRRVPADLVDLIRQRAERLEDGLDELLKAADRFCNSPSTMAGRAIAAQAAECLEVAQELADKCRTVAEMISNYIDNRSAEWWDRSHNVEVYEAWRDGWSETAEETEVAVHILDDVARSAPNPVLDNPSASSVLQFLDGEPFVGGTGALVRWLDKHLQTEDDTPLVDAEQMTTGHWTVENLQDYLASEPLEPIRSCIADDDNIAPFA